jgi:enterochelin esterase-like enzyme
MYIACGTEDDLCEASRAFANFLKSEGAGYYYEEGPGKHDWFFWNEYLDRGLEHVLNRG